MHDHDWDEDHGDDWGGHDEDSHDYDYGCDEYEDFDDESYGDY
ncbi:hypothetical protein ACU610_02730 [Geodermatophilus sp. URMC 61]